MKRLALAAALVLLAACKTLDPEIEPNYASDAEQNMKLGTQALESKNFPDAEKYFEHVRTKYPFLELAREAELKLADAAFEREQYIEARDRYEGFVKVHPTHSKVDYAAFRAALSHFKQIPGDFFFLPSSREKDQTEVAAALKAMQDFIRLYPNSGYVPEAKRVADEARRRRAEHELYVADFYARRGHWGGVVQRLSNVERDYRGLGYDERALFGLHKAYLQLKEPQKANEVLRRIISELPNSSAAERAKRLLGS